MLSVNAILSEALVEKCGEVVKLRDENAQLRNDLQVQTMNREAAEEELADLQRREAQRAINAIDIEDPVPYAEPRAKLGS